MADRVRSPFNATFRHAAMDHSVNPGDGTCTGEITERHCKSAGFFHQRVIQDDTTSGTADRPAARAKRIRPDA